MPTSARYTAPLVTQGGEVWAPRPYGGQKKVCDCFGIYINKKNERNKK